MHICRAVHRLKWGKTRARFFIQTTRISTNQVSYWEKYSRCPIFTNAFACLRRGYSSKARHTFHLKHVKHVSKLQFKWFILSHCGQFDLSVLSTVLMTHVNKSISPYSWRCNISTLLSGRALLHQHISATPFDLLLHLHQKKKRVFKLAGSSLLKSISR